MISTNFVDQADASALLSQIKQHSAAFIRDALQCVFELGTTVTALTEQGVSGKAFGMKSREHGFATADLTQHHGQVFFARTLFHKGVKLEICPGRWQRTAGNVLNLGEHRR
jgi:hypothetical protein